VNAALTGSGRKSQSGATVVWGVEGGGRGGGTEDIRVSTFLPLRYISHRAPISRGQRQTLSRREDARWSFGMWPIILFPCTLSKTTLSPMCHHVHFVFPATDDDASSLDLLESYVGDQSFCQRTGLFEEEYDALFRELLPLPRGERALPCGGEQSQYTRLLPCLAQDQRTFRTFVPILKGTPAAPCTTCLFMWHLILFSRSAVTADRFRDRALLSHLSSGTRIEL